MTVCVCIESFMIVDLSRDSCGTRVFVYALVHVMCLCVYVSMVCQRCMLYDDMYSHDNALIEKWMPSDMFWTPSFMSSQYVMRTKGGEE